MNNNILNKRQIDIIRDLENSAQYISAKSLSESYEVSLRTIRNDINEITEFLSDYDCVFEKIPHVGMRIQSSENIYKGLSRNSRLHSFYAFSEKIRSQTIDLVFLANDGQYVTLSYLMDLFEVSKNTLVRAVMREQMLLQQRSLSLTGFKSKGYRLFGSQSAKEDLLREIINDPEAQPYIDSAMEDEKTLWSKRSLINVILSDLKQYKDIEVIDRRMFKIQFAFLTAYMNGMAKTSVHINLPAGIARDIQNRLEHDLGKHIDQYVCNKIYFILYTTTNFNEEYEMMENMQNDFDNGIRVMTHTILTLCPQLKTDTALLANDISLHLKNTINQQEHGFQSQNPMLSQIKLHNIEAFKLAEKGLQAFAQVFAFNVTEDEVGFIAIYIAMYLEKYARINEAKIMVVCNSGVGAARLLANRINNAFPEIHITMIKSYVDLENDADFLKDIDLIVSTVKISDQIKKPYIVVSPFLSEEELIKIREVIWVVNKIKQRHPDSNEMTGYFTENDKRIKNALDAMHKQNSIHILSQEQIAKVLLESFGLVTKIYPDVIRKEKYPVVEGLLAHVAMSVDRWMNGEFLDAYDYDQLIVDHKMEYDLVIEYLKKVSSIIGTFIAPGEAIAILRYLIL